MRNPEPTLAGVATVSSAVSADNLDIPLIDFGAFVHDDGESKVATANAILHGFQNAGFIYLRNHGISRADVCTAFEESAQFFARPQEQKDSLAWTTARANRGYVCQGREKVTNLTNIDEIRAQRAAEGADLKESMEIGREGVADFPNHWPDGMDEDGRFFKIHMLAFFETCKQLHIKIMSAIAIALDLGETWFDQYCNAGDNTLRLLHYPAVSSNVFRQNKNQVRAGEHSDYGSITLLFQDMAGGLQVLSPNGNYVDATPIPDTIVVNAGDLLSRWSNDTIKSTKHRVVEPSTITDIHPARYSIAYFCNPNFDRFIDAIPGTYDSEHGKKYAGITRFVYWERWHLDERLISDSGEYLFQRLAATY